MGGDVVRFISAVKNNIIRDVYAVGTKDEHGKDCFVINSSFSYDYGEDALPQGIVGVAYSLRGAEKMAHNYIKTESEKVRRDHYPNHTLVDRVS
ncbi:hypothetical protein KAT24_00940 [Candidatus Pacearchaeota archaeon]|nr:hypothetical protein [Candidatus Pacearchaeota archaeon]